LKQREKPVTLAASSLRADAPKNLENSSLTASLSLSIGKGVLRSQAMNAAKLATFCAVRELTFVEAGVADGIKGGWFQTRKRERAFFTEQEVAEFADKVKAGSNRHRQTQASFTS
jgi:hypothetical protein